MMYTRYIFGAALTSLTLFAHADCIDDAAQYHNVNPWILRAIVQIESSSNPNAINVNSNSTVDIGLTGTNEIHFPELAKYGIRKDDLRDPCVSVYTGAWLLRKKIAKYGNTWIAVGAYHSETAIHRDVYIEKIKAQIKKWNVSLD